MPILKVIDKYFLIKVLYIGFNNRMNKHILNRLDQKICSAKKIFLNLKVDKIASTFHKLLLKDKNLHYYPTA
jgi:hypothetical protein